jgi:hypothetical protein
MGTMNYRLWNDKDKMMVYFNDSAFAEHYHKDGVEQKLMKFTGLFDANKMPIFEGDILLERLEDPESQQAIETEYEVMYSNQHAAYVIDESFNKDGTHLFPLAEAMVTSKYKVIRNIYR